MQEQGSSPWFKRSWGALAATLLTFPLAMVVGEGLLSVLADDLADPPVSAVLIAGGLGTAVLLLAPVLSLIFGRRAVQDSDQRGKAPAIVSAVLIIVLLGQALLGLVGAAL